MLEEGEAKAYYRTRGHKNYFSWIGGEAQDRCRTRKSSVRSHEMFIPEEINRFLMSKD